MACPAVVSSAMDPRVPFASSGLVRRRMQAQVRRGTGPELLLRRALHGEGLRYFVHRRPIANLRRDADIVFPKLKVAVFVDGCFWHGCEQHGRRERWTNEWYWPAKIARNRERDADTDARLASAGWTVVRIWEHDPVAESVARVKNALRAAASSVRLRN